MPKRTRASWDFDVISPLKSVPEWLRGDNAAHAEHRPQMCMFDMLLVLGEVQRITGYEVRWEYCHEGGIKLDGELERYQQQNIKGGGYPYRPTLRFTSDAMCEKPGEHGFDRPKVCDFLMDMLYALNDRAAKVRAPVGDCTSTRKRRVEAYGLWHGAGLDAPPLCGADAGARAWEVLLPTIKLCRPEDFMRLSLGMHRCTLVEVEAALRTPFPLGFKVGMDYAWSTESFGVLEAALKRRLRVLRSFSNSGGGSSAPAGASD